MSSKEFLFALLVGVVFGTFFGGVDALFFLLAEEELTGYLQRDIRNRVVLNLVEGSISACFSLLIASFIEARIPINGIKNPFLDCVGILLGTAIVASIYLVYIKYTHAT